MHRALLALLLGGLALIVPASPAPAEDASGAWTLKTPMPAVRSEVAAAVIARKLYAVGGTVAGKAVPRHEEYDPAADRWRALAPLPVARDHLGLAVVNGRIYTFGGFTESTHKGAGTDVFEYDPGTDTWRARAPRCARRGRRSVSPCSTARST